MTPREALANSAERQEPSDFPVEDATAAPAVTVAEPSPAAPPAFVPKPPLLTAGYILAATVVALTQGLGLSFISTNLQQIAGPMHITQSEAAWLMAAYLFPNVSLSVLVFKLRAQYGLRNFCEVAIVAYVLICIAHLWVDSYQGALTLRFFAGIAAAPMSSVAFLYMLEPIAPQRKLNIGLCLALTALALPTPVAGLISPALLDIGGYHALYAVEMGMAMVSLGLIYLLPLASPPREKVIRVLDLITYSFLAVAMGLFAIVLVVGRFYWWREAEWLGWLMVGSIAAAVAVAVIELNRRDHLLDIRWLTSREIIHFTGALLVFRIILSEQSSGAISFLRTMGLQNEQFAGLYWVILAAALMSGIVCAAVMKPGREAGIHAVSLLLLAIGSYLDSQSTALTRPEQMYLSQMLIGFASGLFLPPAVAIGLTSALKRGPKYVLSFIIVFLTTQKVGGFIGSALFGTFVQWREQFHSFRIVSKLQSTDPLVAQRLRQLGSAYGKVLTDPAQQNAQGAQLLAKQATQQAYALAYNDAFLMTALLALLALSFLLVHVAWRNRQHWLPSRLSAPAHAAA